MTKEQKLQYGVRKSYKAVETSHGDTKKKRVYSFRMPKITESYQDHEFRLTRDEFYVLGAKQGLSSDEVPHVLAILMSLSQQESSHNYHVRGIAVYNRTYHGERAIGRYQIMPKNWIHWTRKYIGTSAEDFPPTPENQDRLAFLQACQYFKKHQEMASSMDYIATQMALDWYGRGKPMLGQPSTREYAERICQNYRRIV